MVTEDYVSFETAKLLKEKGFEAECLAFYASSKEIGVEFFYSQHGPTNFNYYDTTTSAPTIQMVMKWLRDVHHIHITIECGSGRTLVYFSLFRKVPDNKPISSNLGYFETYEETCDEAIKYCLKKFI